MDDDSAAAVVAPEHAPLPPLLRAVALALMGRASLYGGECGGVRAGVTATVAAGANDAAAAGFADGALRGRLGLLRK